MNRAKVRRAFNKNFEEEKDIRKKEIILRNKIINKEDIEKKFEENLLKFINELNKS
jgi:hypothetical protein